MAADTVKDRGVALNRSVSVLAKFGAVLGVFTGVFALTWWLYYPHSAFAKQQANLALARSHLWKVEAILRQTPGAGKLTAGTYTGRGGCLGVNGDVPDEPVAKAVIRAVRASTLPVAVDCKVTINRGDMVQKVVKRGNQSHLH